MLNVQNIMKYFLMLSIVTISTFYIPNCSIMNEHAIYIGLLAATTFVLFMGYMFFLSFSPVYLTEIAGSSFGMGIIVLFSGIIHAIVAPYKF